MRSLASTVAEGFIVRKRSAMARGEGSDTRAAPRTWRVPYAAATRRCASRPGLAKPCLAPLRPLGAERLGVRWGTHGANRHDASVETPTSPNFPPPLRAEEDHWVRGA